jgi:hypothetical protein
MCSGLTSLLPYALQKGGGGGEKDSLSGLYHTIVLVFRRYRAMFVGQGIR